MDQPAGVHRPYVLLLVVLAALGPLLFGFHLAELNAPENVLTCRTNTNNQPSSSSYDWLPECIPMSRTTGFATVSSVYTLGALVGALSAGPVSSSRGRLQAMRLTAGIGMIGSVCETLASGVGSLAFGRVVTGIAAGASTVIVPLYISEIAPPSARGLYGTMTQIAINMGILITQVLGYFLSYADAWRWIFAAGFFLAAAQAIGLAVVPESPAWLADNGQLAKAKEVLLRLRGSGADMEAEMMAWGGRGVGQGAPLLGGGGDAEDGHDRDPIIASAIPPPAIKAGTHLGVWEVLGVKEYRPAMIAVVGVMFVQQVCGINSIVMYSVSLLNNVLPASSALISVLISAVNLVASISCSPLPDRLGRKACLLLSIAGQGTSAFVLAFSILYGVKALSAVFVFTFVAAFALGLGPVPFILASEMVGQDAVGAAQSWALGSNYVATFLVAQFFPLVNLAMNNALGGAGWVYFVFAGLAALSAVFVFWRVPETKGKKSLDEVWGRTSRLD